jgi:hypothetical protein
MVKASKSETADGLLHPRLRTLPLPHEVVNKAERTIDLEEMVTGKSFRPRIFFFVTRILELMIDVDTCAILPNIIPVGRIRRLEKRKLG